MIKTSFILLCIITSSLFGEKFIKIDLSNQKLYAYSGDKLFYSCKISSGKRGHFTPNGTFHVILKDKYHKSSAYPKRKNGVNGGASMRNTLKFTKLGHAIHAGKVRNFPASHGCVRVSYFASKKLFSWADIGTAVKVVGVTKNNSEDYKLFDTEIIPNKKSNHKKKNIITKNNQIPMDGFGNWGRNKDDFVEIGDFSYIN